MAGTSKSYFRVKNSNGGSYTEKTVLEEITLRDGTKKQVPIKYREWDAYIHKYTPGSNVMNNEGVCTSNSGMSPGYYAQGPEHGDGGPQI